jgi:hypothetical protein
LRTVANPAAERETVGPGQHQVEDDEIGPLSLQEFARGVAVFRLERRIPLATQILDDHVPDRRLVVDDQNGLHSRILHRQSLQDCEIEGGPSQAARIGRRDVLQSQDFTVL